MAIQYYMRGYNTSAPGAVGYVDWVVNDVPDSTATYVPAPYISGNIINITVNRIVSSKVDNFLKPFESLTAIGGTGSDGYFFHLNSYDWLHTTPPGPPIPVPSYLIGLSVVRGSADGITPRDYATLFWAENALKWLFAYNTNGDGITIGPALPVGMGSLTVDGYIEVGTDPAQSGIIRIPNNQFIVSRNASNTGDGYLIGQDTLDRVRLGSPPGNQIYIPANLRVDGYIRDGSSLPATSGFIRNGNGSDIIVFRDIGNVNDVVMLSSDGSTNTVYLGDVFNDGIYYNVGVNKEHLFNIAGIPLLRLGTIGGTSYIKFDSASVFPVLTQTDTSVGNGANLRIQAQTSSAGTSAGGSVVLSSGHGTSSDGYIDLRVNNVPKIRVFGSPVPATPDFPSGSGSNPNTIEIFNPTVRFYDSVASPTITQIPINSTNGQDMLVLSQPTTGVGFKSGDLKLSSGSSNVHAKDGYVRLQTGQIDRLFVDATANRITETLSIFAFNGLDGTFDAAAVTNPIIRQRDDITNSITGQLMTLQAQHTTGTGTIGGSLNITSGHGTTADGYVRIQLGGTFGLTRMMFDGTANRATLTMNTFAFNGVDGTFDGSSIGQVVNPTIKQRDDIQNGVTGQTLTMQSQNVTGTNAIAGNMVLNTGSGTALNPVSVSGPAYTKHGHLFFKIGTNTTNNVGEFFIDGYGPYLSVGGTTTAPAAIDGYVRVPNNTWALSAARNPASPPTASIHLIGTNSTNQILIGEQADTTYIPGTLIVGTFNTSTVLEVEDRIIHANFNVAQAGTPVNPPALITGLTIHRGNNAVPVYNDEAGWIWVEGTHLNADDGYWKAASVLAGNDVNLATSLNMQARALSVTDHPNSITAGNPTPVAGSLPTVGGLRTYNGSTAVASRTADGSQNLLLLGTDSTNHIIMGAATSPFNTGFIFNTTPGSVYDFQVNSVSNKIQIGDGYIRSGATPSLTGIFRNTQTASVSNPIVTSRNFLNTLDMILLGTDGYDKIVHGASAVNTGHVFNTSTGSIYDFQVNSVSNVQLGAGEIDADGYAETIAIGSTVLSPRMYQITLAGTGATDGYSFKINAQNGQQQTGVNNNTKGGVLVLGSGAAGTGGSGAAGQDGYVNILNGNTLTATFFNGEFDGDGYAEWLAVGPTIFSPRLYQTILPGTGANDGYSFKINAQDGRLQSGVNNNNNGGVLVLGSGAAGTGGSGTAGKDGYVDIFNGSTLNAQHFNADFDGDGYSEWLGAGPNIVSPKMFQLVKPGTGANDGYAFKIMAQAGQQQTGVNNNNKGGNVLVAGGKAGTGGSGTAGTDGYVGLMSGDNLVATAGPNKLIFNQGRRRHITPVSTTYQVLVTDDYLAVTSSTSYTITLPASPTLGDTYEFKDINGTATTNNITIAGNGNNIDGSSTLAMNTNFASFVVTYTGAQWSVS